MNEENEEIVAAILTAGMLTKMDFTELGDFTVAAKKAGDIAVQYYLSTLHTLKTATKPKHSS